MKQICDEDTISPDQVVANPTENDISGMHAEPIENVQQGQGMSLQSAASDEAIHKVESGMRLSAKGKAGTSVSASIGKSTQSKSKWATETKLR